MKKILLMVALAVGSLSVFAQKTTTTTTTSIQFNEVRKPQVFVEPIVKPLVVEVEILKDKPTFFETTLPKSKVLELGNDFENVKNYGLFLYAAKTSSDMIVAATYNFYTNPDHQGDEDWFKLEIKGFPAKFVNWHTATTDDYEWMRIKHLYSEGGAKTDVFEKVKE